MKIKSISIVNFLTFKKFEYNDFSNFNVIYGANGAGKSNFVSIAYFLKLLHNKTMIISNATNGSDEDFVKAVNDLYQTFVTINTKAPIKIRIAFELNDKNGIYEVHLNSKNIVIYENLKYRLETRIQNIFTKTEEKIIVNEQLKPGYKLFKKNFEENSGSVISLFSYLIKTNNLSTKNNDSHQLLEVLSDAMDYTDHSGINLSTNFIVKLKPVIKVNNEDIDRLIKLLTPTVDEFESLVREIDTKVEGVYYKKISDNKITLMMEYKLNSKIISVPFDRLSSGTKKYLSLFNVINHNKKDNKVIFWDDFDLHMHKNLQDGITKYLKNMSTEQGCQIFLTTHSTSMLDMDELTNKEKMVIDINPSTGVRELKTLQGNDIKEKKEKRYLLGKYGGAPTKSNIYWEPNE